MARYIDADKLCKELTDMARYQDPYKQSTILGVVSTIENTRTADVVPRSEVDNLEYTLLGVMHSVDKWLDGDELEQDEVNRAITMREKTLRLLETAKIEAAREIFEEIEAIIKNQCLTTTDERGIKGYVDSSVHFALAELKKKYTETSK